MRNKDEKPEIRFYQKEAWLQFNTHFTGEDWKMKTWAHLPLLRKCQRLLRKIGFTVGKDPYYEKLFPTLSHCHSYGKWRELEVKIEIRRGALQFDFYQNINFKNPNGGQYDYDKYEKMPYLCQKRFQYACQQLRKLIAKEVEGVLFESVDRPENAEQALLRGYKESWHHHGVETLADVQGSLKDYDLSQNSWDRDKKQLLCGQVKYFRGFDGYLRRGVVYWSLNSQWYVILHPTSYVSVSASHLFDPTPADFAVRRLKKGRIPEAKQRQLDLLNSLSLPALRKQMERMARAPKRVAA